MDDATFLLAVFGLLALLIGVVFSFFGRWGRLIAAVMVVVWCYQAQGYARMAWNGKPSISDQHEYWIE